MATKKIRARKAEDLNLLPFMNLFSILIPFLLSCAVFEKLGILELNLPERSMNVTDPADVDPMKLNLAIIITDKYLTIGAAGGFDRNMYYRENVQYRSKSDGNTFTREFVQDEEVKSPTDGKVMTPHEREFIYLDYLDKKDSSDPGVYMKVARNTAGDAILDSAGAWFKRIPAVGERYTTVGGMQLRTMSASENARCTMSNLTAYEAIALRLWELKKGAEAREEVPEDIDQIVVLAAPSTIYDKVIHCMDAAKFAGFAKVSLSLLGG